MPKPKRRRNCQNLNPSHHIIPPIKTRYPSSSSMPRPRTELLNIPRLHRSTLRGYQRSLAAGSPWVVVGIPSAAVDSPSVGPVDIPLEDPAGIPGEGRPDSIPGEREHRIVGAAKVRACRSSLGWSHRPERDGLVGEGTVKENHHRMVAERRRACRPLCRTEKIGGCDGSDGVEKPSRRFGGVGFLKS